MRNSGSDFLHCLLQLREFYDPLNAIFVSEHSEVCPPRTITHRCFNLSSNGEFIKDSVRLFFVLCSYMDLAPILALVHLPHKCRYVVSDEYVAAIDWQDNLHNFIRFALWYLKLFTCKIFEAHYFSELSTKYGLIEREGFFGVTVKVDPGA